MSVNAKNSSETDAYEFNRRVIAYCLAVDEKKEEELRSSHVMAVGMKMIDAGFRAWLEKGMRLGFVDETSVELLRVAATDKTLKLGPQRKDKRQRQSDDVEGDGEEDDGNSVFKRPLLPTPTSNKQRVPVTVHCSSVPVPPPPSVASLAERVKEGPRRERLSSKASYYAPSDDEEEAAEEDDDDDDDDAVRIVEGPQHRVKRGVVRFWSLVLEVDNKKNADGHAKDGITALTSSCGKALYVLGDYRTKGHRTSAANKEETHHRHVFIVTDGNVDSKAARLNARTYFKASNKYRPTSCYFNVTEAKIVDVPFVFFKETLYASKGDATEDARQLALFREALQKFNAGGRSS